MLNTMKKFRGFKFLSIYNRYIYETFLSNWKLYLKDIKTFMIHFSQILMLYFFFSYVLSSWEEREQKHMNFSASYAEVDGRRTIREKKEKNGQRKTNLDLLQVFI